MANAFVEYLRSTTYFGNTLESFLIATVITILFIAVLSLVKGYLLLFFKRVAKRTKNTIDDVVVAALGSFGMLFFCILGLYLGLLYLSLPEAFLTVARAILLIVVVVYIIKALHIVIDAFASGIVRKNSEADENLVNLLSLLAKYSLWIIAILLILSNLGINITSLLAGVGIGGIAIAFALKNILEDLFSSFSIYFDKPFRKGDFIIIGDDMGVVKEIGLKTTRIQALQGQEIVISNRELTSSRIHNYKKMKERRIVFGFGVAYETSSAKVKKIPTMVSTLFKKIKNVRLDRVHFKKFGDSALAFEVVYYIDSNDYALYMDRQQEINVLLKEALGKAKIDFAYPTRTVYVKK